MPKDVEAHFLRGSWRFKALTERAKEAMGADMGGPWQMASSVFWQDVPDSKYHAIVARLKELKLQLEDDDEQKPWEF